ncbi:MAG: hypothetical protein H6744_19455 [Deltaproteobacteria bacterium]|nr:hypothetical protein [Deltaproteobacteria bacterium]MCB9788858.1 hypothetical protein [Deltaproteobacteria bacterium]
MAVTLTALGAAAVLADEGRPAQDEGRPGQDEGSAAAALSPEQLDRIRGMLLGQRKADARAELERLRVPSDPWLMQQLAALWAWAGDTQRARSIVAPLAGSKAPEHIVARAILGEPDPYGPGPGELQGDAACQLATLASYLYDISEPELAARLAHDVRTRTEGCRQAWMIELNALSSAHRTDEVHAAMDQALAALPDDPIVLRAVANQLRAERRTLEASALLERAVRADPEAQGVLREWLSASLHDPDEREEVTARMEAALAKDPNDAIARFFLGVTHHYTNDFELSNELLAPLEASFGHEERFHIYRAMNDFNLGDRDAALARLRSQLTRPYVDPDVFYCIAEIQRDANRPEAIALLGRYVRESESSPVANHEKLERVRSMIAALQECEAEGTAVCDGPWEHPRRAMMRKQVIHYALIGLAVLLPLAALGWWMWRRRRRGRA